MRENIIILSSSLALVCEDASKILIATRSCFSHTSIDYAYQINVLFNQHKTELVELLLSCINIHKAFFRQGHELLSVDTEQDFNTIVIQVVLILSINTIVHHLILVNKNATN